MQETEQLIPPLTLKPEGVDVSWILTLASHFLWVAVLHTKKNESREGGMKENKTKVLVVRILMKY